MVPNLSNNWVKWNFLFFSQYASFDTLHIDCDFHVHSHTSAQLAPLQNTVYHTETHRNFVVQLPNEKKEKYPVDLERKEGKNLDGNLGVIH